MRYEAFNILIEDLDCVIRLFMLLCFVQELRQQQTLLCHLISLGVLNVFCLVQNVSTAHSPSEGAMDTVLTESDCENPGGGEDWCRREKINRKQNSGEMDRC